MFRDRKFIMLLCLLLCVALGVLFFMEHKDPERGSELMRTLIARVRSYVRPG